MVTFNAIIVLLQLIGVIACLRPILEPPQTREDDFVLMTYRTVPRTLSRSCYHGKTLTSKRSYNACIAVLPTQIYSNFSITLPKGGCGYTGNTSVTASYNNCTYATNGGYFDTRDGDCVGNVISNGVVQQVTGISRVNFGINNHSYVIGYLTNNTLNNGKFNFSQLLTGAGWLVRSGMSYINKSASMEDLDTQFITERAPRTGICVALNGSLIILQIDGEEDKKIGVNLIEFSEILVDIGCWQAVNLDGGGSSTSVYRGKIVNRPSCKDTPTICERPVSSITCIKA